MPLSMILEGLAEVVFEIIARGAVQAIAILIPRRRRAYSGTGRRNRRTLKQRVKVYCAEKTDRPVEILSKPDPVCSLNHISPRDCGPVRLKVICGRDGTIKHVNLVAGSNGRMVRSAISAARQIQFSPAIKDGRPVAQWVELDYRFDATEK